MLKNTFCHLNGLGMRYEKRLWSDGIFTWDALLDKGHASVKKEPSIAEEIRHSVRRLSESDHKYFVKNLPVNQHWRMFSAFRKQIAYLDIETNGFMGEQGYITTISLYDGANVHYYVSGKNLRDFKRDIEKYKLIVTYNGKCFDVPFIEKEFDIKMEHAHIDLRFVLRELGFMGGLKACEKELGIDREELAGVDGYFAVLLWNEFKRHKNVKALETLLAYNIQDVVNMEPLMILAYNHKLATTPFQRTHKVVQWPSPTLPFSADVPTIRKIFSENSRHFPAGVV